MTSQIEDAFEKINREVNLGLTTLDEIKEELKEPKTPFVKDMNQHLKKSFKEKRFWGKVGIVLMWLPCVSHACKQELAEMDARRALERYVDYKEKGLID